MRPLFVFLLSIAFQLPLLAQKASFQRSVIDINDNTLLAILAIGDLNKDGVPDLIGIDNSGDLVVQLSNGPGKFNFASQKYPVGPNFQSWDRVLVPDFNDDGNLDVVSYTQQGAAIYLGNGDGTFDPNGIPITDGDGQYFRAGDF